MQCMVCKDKEAKVHLTQMIDGKVKKVDLCEDCAKEKGVDDPAGFSLADLLMGLGAAQEMAQATTSVEGQAACAECGFTQADFKKTGRLGCAQCYTTFADGLAPLLKNMHKGTRHVGRVPRAFRQGRDTEQKLGELQRKLGEAVAAENYEEAARVRDAIKTLKAGPALTS